MVNDFFNIHIIRVLSLWFYNFWNIASKFKANLYLC